MKQKISESQREFLKRLKKKFSMDVTDDDQTTSGIPQYHPRPVPGHPTLLPYHKAPFIIGRLD